MYDKFIFLTLLIIFLSVPDTEVQARMYKWVDKDGNTHYTQKPPPEDIDGEVIKTQQSSDHDSAIEALKKQEEGFSKRRGGRLKAEEEAEQQKQLDQQMKERCEQSKKRLASYQQPRVNIKNQDGSVRRAPEEERQAEITKSHEYIKKYCK